ncbi:17704_t:CDS:1, partial [Funneliformis geosporum]
SILRNLRNYSNQSFLLEPPWSHRKNKRSRRVCALLALFPFILFYRDQSLSIMLDGSATLFAGKGSPIGLDNFSEILN